MNQVIMQVAHKTTVLIQAFHKELSGPDAGIEVSFLTRSVEERVQAQQYHPGVENHRTAQNADFPSHKAAAFELN